MKTIWKFELDEKVVDQTLDMPENSHILHVGFQSNVCLWALVDTESKLANRTFAIHGTGNKINDWEHKIYIGTTHDIQLGLVWHVFEILK
jgi:hypothetical protein